MKAITFLGVGNYQETTYVHQGMSCRARLFPVALCRFLCPDELLVLVTKDARAKWLDELRAQVAPLGIEPTPIDIPDGHSVDDLWEIFGCLTEQLNEGDRVVFDITHSFRTLPFLTFLAASYLRVARKVELHGIYYGAWEARQPLSQPAEPTDLAPVFDLSPFISLLDWTTATDQFLKTGSAQSLAALTSAGQIRTTLEQVSQGLHLLRPLDVMQSACDLPAYIHDPASTIQISSPPFAALLERIERDYGALGLRAPMEPANRREFLDRLLKMVDWYLAKGQTVHALALAREWLPTWLCCHFGVDPLIKENREEMEALLWGTRKGKLSPHWSRWAAVPVYHAIGKLWFDICAMRNDVLHSGFVHDSDGSEFILSRTTQYIHRLKSLAGQWKIEGPTS